MNCSQIYIGVSQNLQEIEGEFFSVELIFESDSEFLKLKSILNTNHIYYLAPHTGCGCGWEVINTGTDFDNRSRESFNALGAYLYDLTLKQLVNVLACNQSYNGFSLESVMVVKLSKFLVDLDSFRPRFGEYKARLYLLENS